jgi:hypothetical protein
MQQLNTNLPSPWPLAPHEISQLADFIEQSLRHFTTCRSSGEASYHQHLGIIQHCYYLVRLEREQEKAPLPTVADCKNKSDVIPLFASSLAEIINLVADKIRLIDNPWFYAPFEEAIRTLLNNRMAQHDDDLILITNLRTKILGQRGNE